MPTGNRFRPHYHCHLPGADQQIAPKLTFKWLYSGDMLSEAKTIPRANLLLPWYTDEGGDDGGSGGVWKK